MKNRPLSLGLDSSTQSLTAVLADLSENRIVWEGSLDYASDPRLNRFGIDFESYIIPPRETGEADQPPRMFLASLDAMFDDMKKAGLPLSAVAVVNFSGQQHGHVYLSAAGCAAIRALGDAESAGGDLLALLGDAFSYGGAPIWKTANTTVEAEQIRAAAGGKAGMITLSGSDSPLRFTGAVVRRVGRQFPDLYANTARIQLISSFLPGVMCADPDVPWDFGNGCGTSLMDYASRDWAPALIAGASEGLPGGAEALRSKLPGLAAPDAVVGHVAAYFSEKYGFSPDCLVAAGSGDNPQTKVLVEGDLLSLGTSFVNMVSTDGKRMDREGFANAMYDGIGRPFTFGCRTNGALVWDRVRALHGQGKKDYAAADAALAGSVPGAGMVLWQPDEESFPPSRKFDLIRRDAPSSLSRADAGSDYGGIIDSSLAAVYLYSRGFAAGDGAALFITGGPASSPLVVNRIAAIWNRPVVTIGRVGAALGTAVAGAGAYWKHGGADDVAARVKALSAGITPRGDTTKPEADAVRAYHAPGGYLERFHEVYKEVTGRSS